MEYLQHSSRFAASIGKFRVRLTVRGDLKLSVKSLWADGDAGGSRDRKYCTELLRHSVHVKAVYTNCIRMKPSFPKIKTRAEHLCLVRARSHTNTHIIKHQRTHSDNDFLQLWFSSALPTSCSSFRKDKVREDMKRDAEETLRSSDSVGETDSVTADV